MPRIHNQLYRGAFSAALKNAVGDQKGEGGLERYGETLTPVVDLWSLPEWAFLRGERRVGGGFVQAAGGATTLAAIAVVNPANSNFLVTFEVVRAQVPALAACTLALHTAAAIEAALTTVIIANNIDTRFGNVNDPVAKVRSGGPVGSLGVFLSRVTFPAGLPDEFPEAVGIVLSPGFGLVVQNTDDAAEVRANFVWRERAAFPGELA